MEDVLEVQLLTGTKKERGAKTYSLFVAFNGRLIDDSMQG